MFEDSRHGERSSCLGGKIPTRAESVPSLLLALSIPIVTMSQWPKSLHNGWPFPTCTEMKLVVAALPCFSWLRQQPRQALRPSSRSARSCGLAFQNARGEEEALL
jgi:hypothetical protein